MSTPPLSHFPDLCLLAIFKHIPLSDLIRHIGLVCPNWARVQLDELKRRHSTKHLVIVQDYSQCQLIEQHENPYESDLIKHVRADDGLPWARVELPQLDYFNTLRVPGDVLIESFTSGLIALLPNITHLTIFQKNLSPIDSVVVSLEQIVLLLNQYSTKLVSLKLHFISLTPIQTRHYNNESSVCALFNSINRLTSLQHLSLSVKFPDFQAQPRLSILSRLTTFTVGYFEPSSLLLKSVCIYATAGDVRVDCGLTLSEWKLWFYAQLFPQLATIFIRVSVSFHELDKAKLFCTRFTSLTTLRLEVFMPMIMVAQALSQLAHLISLSLSFCQILEDTNTLLTDIVQVTSVRLLTLDIRTRSHLDTERLHLHRIFPNLQVLHLIQYNNRCGECKFKLSNDHENDARLAHCVCLARQPFRQCANLHTVKLEMNPTFPLQPVELLTVDQWHALDSRILAEYKHPPRKPTHNTTPLTPTRISNINFDKLLSFLSICKKCHKPQTA